MDRPEWCSSRGLCDLGPGSTSLSHRPPRRRSCIGGHDLGIFSDGAWQTSRIGAIGRLDVRDVDPGSMMVSNRLALAVIPSAASVRLHGRMADVALEARARRPRPLVDFG
jgi:hypothetical protein